MKFKKLETGYAIKIKGEWYILCCCETCLEVHAFSFELDPRDSRLSHVDRKIACCDIPNNWCVTDGENDKVEKAVKEFIEINS